jgi:hypothetical protein
MIEAVWVTDPQHAELEALRVRTQIVLGCAADSVRAGRFDRRAARTR